MTPAPQTFRQPESMPRPDEPAESTVVKLPLFLSPVAAGFPSPADNFLEKRLDLNEYLIKNPPATYLSSNSRRPTNRAGSREMFSSVACLSLSMGSSCAPIHWAAILGDAP